MGQEQAYDANKMSKKNINLTIKIIAVIVVFIFGFVFGLMPFFIKKCRNSSKFLGLANAFSGGIFIGIGLFHLLPEGVEKFEPEEGKEETTLQKIRLAYLLPFITYSLVLFVEKVAFNSHSLLEGAHEHGHHHHHHHDSDDNDIDNIPNSPLVRDSTASEKKEEHDEEKNEKNNHENEEQEKEQPLNPTHEDDNKPAITGSKLTPYILLIALGLHGFFEGIACGIQSEIKGTCFVFGAIIAHKWAESLTLGIAFTKANTEKKQFLIMSFIFSLIGPLGLIIGIIASRFNSKIVEGVFMTLSTGTFLYVACSEVIVEEFESDEYKYQKFGLYMGASVLMYLLALVELISGGDDDAINLVHRILDFLKVF